MSDLPFELAVAAALRWRATRRLLAASLLTLSPWVQAGPTLVDQFSQQTYDVSVRAGSDLRGFSGYSGVALTGWASEAGLTGSGVILEAFAGEFRTLSQTLKLHFQAKNGFTFTTLDFSHLLSWFNNNGGNSGQASWVLDDGDGSPLTGTTGRVANDGWGTGGTWSDFTQPSPTLAVDARSFDLDITLFYTASGFPGGCFTVTGTCTQISANLVRIWAGTAVAPIVPDPGRVPEPAGWALAMTGLALLGLGRARRGRSAHRARSAARQVRPEPA